MVLTGGHPFGWSQIAEILAPDPVGLLLFVNHFPNWQLDFEYERELQAVAAARFLEELAHLRTQHTLAFSRAKAIPKLRYLLFLRLWEGSGIMQIDSTRALYL